MNTRTLMGSICLSATILLQAGSYAEDVPTHYVAYSIQDLTIGDRAGTNGTGLIGSQANVFVGSDARVQGSILANGNVTLYDRSLVSGNVTAGGTVTRNSGATVTGTIQQHAQVTAYTIPTKTFQTGTLKILVKLDSSLTINPGNYDTIKVLDRGKLTLNNGVFNTKALIIGNDTKLIFNFPSGGGIEVNAANALTIGDRDTMKFSNQNNNTAVSFYSNGTSDVVVGYDGLACGTFTAPNAMAIIHDRTNFTGAVYAKKIELQPTIFYSVDTVFPTIRLCSPVPGSTINSTTPRIALWYTDDKSGVDLSSFTVTINGIDRTSQFHTSSDTAWWQVPQNMALAEGQATVISNISDRAGNAVQNIAHFTIDTTKPAIAFVKPINGSISNNDTPMVKITWSDANSGINTATFNCTLDGTDISSRFTVFNDSARYQVLRSLPLSEGVHSLIAKIKDRAGNQQQTTISITVDRTKPVVLITSPANGTITRQNPIAVAWKVDGVVQTTQLSQNLNEGANKIIRTATDAAGNTGKDSITVTLDTYSPVVAITSPANGLLINHSPINVSWTVDGVTQTTQLIQALVEGLNTVTRSDTDAAGNIGTASITVTLDTHAPVVAITSPANGSIVNHTPVDIAWKVDEVPQTTQLSQNLNEGVNKIIRTSTDAAGNTGKDSITVTLDTQAPVVVITSPANGYLTNHTPVNVSWTVDGVAQTTQLTENIVEGANKVLRTMTDAAGNLGKDSITVTLDTLAPVVVITSPANGYLTNYTPVTITWTVDGVAQTTQLTQALVEGANKVLRTMTDAAGNVGKDSIMVTLDTLAPVVAITSPADGYIADHSPINITWTIDGITQTTQLTQDLIEGPNTITRTATDAAGNTGTASINVILGTHAPVVEITSPVNGFLTNHTPVDVAWTVDGVAQTTQTHETLAIGINLIIRSATNASGKIGADTVTVTLINQPPVARDDSRDLSIIGMWGMNESSGTHVFDSSGFGNDGLITGEATRVQGKTGMAVKFDGVNGLVTVADNPALRIADALSIEFWGKRNRLGIDVVLEKGGSWETGQTNYGVAFHSDPSYNYMFYFYYSGGWRGTSGVTDTGWHHYIITAKEGDANPKLYIDGMLRVIQFGGGSNVHFNLSTADLHVGAQIYAGLYSANTLSNLTIYHRILSDQEAALQYSKSYLTNAPRYVVKAGTSLAISVPGVLGNDYDPDGDSLTSVLISQPGNGAMSLNQNGSFTYTPGGTFIGVDSFYYKAFDGIQYSEPAKVLISVVDKLPVAFNDSRDLSIIGMWGMNESSGTHVFDSSGFGNDGLITGEATRVQGKTGMAVKFDGVNGLVTVADNPALRIADALSIEFWGKRNRLGTDVVLEKGGSWTNGKTNYAVAFNESWNYMCYFYYAGGWQGTSGVTDTGWHHYIITAQEGDAQAKFYIDGVSRAVQFSGGTPNIHFYQSTADLHIGAQVDGGYYSTNTISNLTIYHRILSEQEVTNEYKTGFLINTPKFLVKTGQPFTIASPGVLGNDYDLDGDLLTAILISPAVHGTVTLNADGSFSYTSVNGYVGIDSFTYRAFDGFLYSQLASVFFTVIPQQPIVKITSPLNGAVLQQTPISVTWTVNGINQKTQNSENLIEGDNKIIRLATDVDGDSGADSITVNYNTCMTYHDTSFTLYGNHHFSCLILTNGTITSYGKITAEYVSIRSNGNLYMADSLNARYVEILSGGNISHPTGIVQNNICTVYGLRMKADTLKILNGGKIDVTGMGYPNGRSINCQVADYTRAQGGNHGGMGNNAEFSTFDDYLAPAYPGGGGNGTGGSGGGIVKITASMLQFDGQIIANGINSYYGCGAGGSVWIVANEMRGNGSIQANGGYYGYAGGGGRIAVYATDMSGAWLNNLNASGFNVGTIYLQDGHGYHDLQIIGNCNAYSPVPFGISDTLLRLTLGSGSKAQINGDCRIKEIISNNYSNLKISGKSKMHRMLFNGGGLVELGDSLFLDSCILDSNTTMTQKVMTSDTIWRLAVTTGYLELKSGSKIDVTGKGYPNGRSINGQVADYTRAQGGNHGGMGNNAEFSTYDNYLAPAYPGGGGNGTGGSGGGIVKITATTFQCDGQIIANGINSYYGCGAGGSVWISTDTLRGSGSIKANGGNDGYWGGGGRIAVYATDLSGTLLDSLSAFGFNAGTIYLRDGHGYRDLKIIGNCAVYSPVPDGISDTLLRLTLGSGSKAQINGDCRIKEVISSNYSGLKINGKSRMHRMLFSGGGVIELGDTLFLDTCVLDSNTTMTQKLMASSDTIWRLAVTAGYLELKSGSKIDVTGKGYPNGRSINGQVADYTRAQGGNHGGMGNNAEFSTYDDYLAPAYPGGGGNGTGGSGGGIIKITATTFQCDGQIIANGINSYYGCGAGGSVWIAADEMRGNGSIQANGGDYGYAGGGGRMAIYCCAISNTIKSSLSVEGYHQGTIYMPCSSGVCGPVVEIRSPKKNDASNSSPIRIEWYVNGVKQLYDTLENLVKGYNTIKRSFTDEWGLTGSDTVNVAMMLSDNSTTVYGPADFLKGSLQNIDTLGGIGVRLSDTIRPFNFIWVAVSTKGTVVKIDTKTGRVLGEYHTSPAGEPKDPSRTTVDRFGNVWVTNRAGNSVTRIGLLENNQCVDRNGDGKITTSQGLNDTLPWTNANGANTNGGVSTAEDECICMYTKVSSSGTRHVSVDKNNDVWVSGIGNRMFDLIDGKTGLIKRTEPSVGYGGYGGLMDTNGVIWSSNPLLRWDTKNHLTGPNGVNWRGYDHQSYGLGIDSKGNVWNSSFGSDGLIRKFAPDGTQIGAYNEGSVNAQGCAVDRNDNVWVAHSLYGPNTVGHLLNNGTFIGNVPVGSGPTGVAVDADGKIWTTNYNDGTVSRIDPSKGPIGADGITHVGAMDLTTVSLGGNPYNYSDMTGSTLKGAPKSGIWVYIYDSRVINAQWGKIAWKGHVCDDGSIKVVVASGISDTSFSPAINVQNGASFSVPDGRYLKISVSFIRATTGESPLLYQLNVATINHPLDTIANTGPTAEAGPNRFILLPCDSTELKGTVCDDGLGSGPLTSRWRRLDNGPGTVTFGDSTAFATVAHFSAVGTYTLGLWASDSVYSTMDTVVVYQDTVNRPPVFVSTPVTTGNVGMSYVYIAQATDPDRAETIRYSLENPPGGMTIGTLSGQVSWTPSDSGVGVHTIAIIAQDNHGATARQEYGLTISPRINYPPVFTSSAPTNATKGGLYAYQAQAQDADSDPLSFLLVSGPAGMTVSSSGLVQWTPTVNQIGTNQVAIAVSDGLHSVSQQFAIVVANVNDPPSIVSSPVLSAVLGAAYTYRVVATDPDNDPLTYTLLSAPQGMMVSSGGLIEWPDNGGRQNNAYVAVQVSDPSNAVATQAWNISIVADNVPPVVNILLSANPVRPGETTIITVSATDNVGVVSYGLIVGGATVSLDENHQYSFVPQSVGTVALSATAADNAGNHGSASASLTVSTTADNTAPTVSLSYSPLNPQVGDNVIFSISATDNIAIDPERIWLKVDGIYVPVVNGAATFRALKRGVISAVATAYDMSGNYGEDDATVPVSISGSDAIYPVAQIVSPVYDSVITGPADVIGTATDDNFAYYTLSYKEMNSSDFIEYYRGFQPVNNGELGVFNASLHENGQYLVRLTVFDKYGNGTATQVQVSLEGQKKIGNFSIAFSDMKIPMAGIDLEAVRTYDSRVKTSGDFGIGWRLDLNSIRLSESCVLGEHWNLVPWDTLVCDGGVCVPIHSSQLSPTRKHSVTISLPGAPQQVFDVVLHRFSAVDPTYGYVSFEPKPGTYSKLIALDIGNWVAMDGELYDENGDFTEPMDPQRYKLTLRDSSYYIIDQDQGGVTQITDANGNAVSINSNGISHSAGSNILFSRDGGERISSITDGTGRTINYTYDGHGNLQTVTDANGNVTRFKYAPNSYLNEIIDPRGIRATRTEYDDQGRMVRQINPAGDTLTLDHDLANNRETTKDFNGNETQYTYDDNGNVLTKTDARNNTWTYQYDALNNLTYTRNPDATTKRSTWDNTGNELTSTNERNFTTTRTYGPMGRLLTEQDALNRVTSYVYDANGNLLHTTGPDNHITSEKTYTANGNVLTEADGEGNVTSYAYNGRGEMIAKTDPLGRTTVYVLDNRGQTIADVNAKGDSTKYAFDANGNQVKTVNALGVSTATEYNSFNKVSRQVDARGNATAMEYDLFGQLRKTVAPDSTFTLKTYDGQGNVRTTTDEAGRVTMFEYDQDNRIVKTTFNDGSFTTVEYDALGRRHATVDANHNRTEYGYDAAGNNTTVKDALNHVTTYEYDAVNRRTAMVDALNHRTEYLYDDYDRLIRTTFHDGSYKTTEYDHAGRKVAETDQESKRTAFAYDSVGNLRTVTDPMGHITRYAYDENNNRVTQTDANSHTTTMAYDKLNRMVLRTYPNAEHEHFGYDPNGNQKFKVDGEGDSTVFTYDVRNRERMRRFTNSGHTVETKYTVDGKPDTIVDYRGITVYNYDSRGRQASVVNPDGSFIRSYYDVQSNRKAEVSPADSVVYGYDVLNRMQIVTASTGTTQYFFDAVGNRDSVANANGTSAGYHYDNLNRLVNVTNWGNGTVISSYSYALNNSGIRTAVTEADGSRVDYGYDASYKLTSETRTGTHPYAISYVYDNVGNRLSQTKDGQSTSYVYNNRDQLTSETGPSGLTTYAYDHAGRMATKTDASGTITYSWLDNDRMASVSGPGVLATYDYDAAGQRVTETSGASTKKYLIDYQLPYGQVIAEMDGSGNPLANYVYGLDRISMTRGASTHTYSTDGQGSIRQLTNVAGTVSDEYFYTAFGTQLARTGTTVNPFMYVGEAFDANSGFYNNRARWYDPQHGTFASVDPEDGDPQTPVSLHRYLYANASPTNYADPSGRDIFDLATAFIAMSMNNTSATNAQPTFQSSSNTGVLLLTKNELGWRGGFSGNGGYLNLLVEFDLAIIGNKNNIRIVQYVAGEKTEKGVTDPYPEWTVDGPFDYWWDGNQFNMGAGDLGGKGHQPTFSGRFAKWYDAPGFHSPGIGPGHFPVRYTGFNQQGSMRFRVVVMDNKKKILKELFWEIYINYSSPTSGEHY